MPGEFMCRAAEYPLLAYHRPGDNSRPLVILLPGGGHLGRIFYGHPGAFRDDFLDSRLETAGYGVLVLSYPSDAAMFDRVYPAMTVSDCADAVWEAAEAVAPDHVSAGNVVVAGWSLAGELTVRLGQHARKAGVDRLLFIALAAMPPFPGLANFTPGGEQLTEDGLWLVDSPLPLGMTRVEMWLADLAGQDRLNGRTVIDEATYRKYYLCNNPIGLRGQTGRFRDGKVVEDLPGALTDTQALSLDRYPTVGAIVPEGASDARLALAGAQLWTGINARSLSARFLADRSTLAGIVAPDRWHALRLVFDDLGRRLTRTVPGGHFFFVGDIGARQTTAHIGDLIDAASDIHSRLAALASDHDLAATRAHDT